jgi:hypothetical protein
MEEMLLNRVDERGRSELVSEEAFEELEGAMKRTEIATIVQAGARVPRTAGDRLLSHPESVGGLVIDSRAIARKRTKHFLRSYRANRGRAIKPEFCG